MHRLLAALAALQIVWLSSLAMAACPPLASFGTGGRSGQAASAILGRVQAPPPVTPPRPMPEGPLGEAVVTLERSGCFGSCPAYRVELRGEGVARFEGRGWVLAPGEHSLPLDREGFACLFEHLREADFWSLPDGYVANATDGPTYRLTVTIGGQTKTVKDYMGRLTGMPVALTQLEAEIDQLGAAPWVHGNDATLDLLAAEGLDFRSPEAGAMLARAVEDDNAAMVKALLARGAPPWGRLDDWFPGDNDETMPRAPELAAENGNAALLQALIEAGGAGSGAPAGMKERILLAAADSSDLPTLKLALSLGPDVNAANPEGRTALMGVVNPNRLNAQTEFDVAEGVRLLLAAGADPRARNAAGMTALHMTYDSETARLLIAAGADVNARDEMGRIPLMAANDDEASLLMLRAGADPRAVDGDGRSVFDYARDFRWKRTLAYLRARGIRK